jgi:hypothetical protein
MIAQGHHIVSGEAQAVNTHDHIAHLHSRPVSYKEKEQHPSGKESHSEVLSPFFPRHFEIRTQGNFLFKFHFVTSKISSVLSVYEVFFGKVTKKTLPSFTRLSTRIVPFCISTSLLQISSPSPLPFSPVVPLLLLPGC